MVEQEARIMSIHIDILENKVLGLRQIEKRLGAIPAWAEERLAGRASPAPKDLSVPR